MDQHLRCDGDLDTAEPKKLRYLLLHIAARTTRSVRRTRLRIAAGWSRADQLLTAFSGLAAIPQAATWPATHAPTSTPLEDPTTAWYAAMPHPDRPPKKIKKQQ
jgi:hypothetical protein